MGTQSFQIDEHKWGRDGQWQFCETVIDPETPMSRISTPMMPADMLILEQHKITGAYRTRSLLTVLRECQKDE